jgi:hypothetical protein
MIAHTGFLLFARRVEKVDRPEELEKGDLS